MSERLKYEPKWSSLDKRPVAQWFKDAKFGIYIHWTVASVPAWGNHSSFYWLNLVESQKQESGGKKYVADSVENEWAGLWDFHVANYGAGVKFQDFAAQFRAELFDADEWAERIERSGAKYAVLTAKHHDGFCLWPDSFTSKTYGHPWNSMEAGPKRDLVGEYCAALRRR